MRPYCTSRLCDTPYESTCDGCRLEAACNAMAVGLCIAGLAAMLVQATDDEERRIGWGSSDAYYAARAGIVLP